MQNCLPKLPLALILIPRVHRYTKPSLKQMQSESCLLPKKFIPPKKKKKKKIIDYERNTPLQYNWNAVTVKIGN